MMALTRLIILCESAWILRGRETVMAYKKRSVEKAIVLLGISAIYKICTK